MKKINNQIFEEINLEEYKDMLSCGCTRIAKYKKHDVIFHTGVKTDEFGIVLLGEIYIENIDFWGNRIILHHIKAQDVFAETYAFCKAPMMVDVISARDSEILFININNLLCDDNKHKSWYAKVLYNFLILSTNKNLAWSNRVFCISPKNIRTRVMNYLSLEAVKCGNNEIIIPFNRQQMADYLNLDRSALSKELGRMKKDGILDFHKNKFYLLNLDK